MCKMALTGLAGSATQTTLFLTLSTASRESTLRCECLRAGGKTERDSLSGLFVGLLEPAHISRRDVQEFCLSTQFRYII